MSRSYESLLGECLARTAEQDALFDQYLALPDRPRPLEWRQLTEVSPRRLVETIDHEHWARWYLERTTMPMPKLDPWIPKLGIVTRLIRRIASLSH